MFFFLRTVLVGLRAVRGSATKCRSTVAGADRRYQAIGRNECSTLNSSDVGEG